jgi:tetratricopeptide (TPR) repeat protein
MAFCTCRSQVFLLALLMFAGLNELSASAESGYELRGRIILGDRKLTRNSLPLVLLEGAKIPYSAHTRADLSGKFKFKKLQPDMFTLIVYIPRGGEYRKTVEVSPGLADENKRVSVEIDFRPNLGSRTLQKTSVDRLRLPEKALKEYEKSREKLGSRDAEGAVAHLKRAVEIAPQFVEAWNTLGTLAYKAADYPLAERYFREALKRDPEYYPAIVNLGGALLTQGKLRDSLPFNLEAVRSRPDEALAHSQLGLNYFYLEQLAEAEEHLKVAISLDRGHFSYPQLPLAEIYLRRNDFAAADRQLHQFLSIHPDAVQSPPVQKRIERIRAAIDAGRP